MLKAREVKQVILSKGFERGVVHVLEVLTEQQRQQTTQMKELAFAVNKMADISASMAAVAENMKDTIETIQPKEDDLDPNTQGLS